MLEKVTIIKLTSLLEIEFESLYLGILTIWNDLVYIAH